jgi:hypothetical protein
MTTITPLRAAAAGATAVAVVVLGLGAGYAWGSHGDGAVAGNRTVALAAALAAASGPAGTSAGPAGITVTGTGTVSGTPDTLRLAMGVAVTQGSVTAALDGANAAAAKLQASLRQHGVAEKDLQTSGLSIQPQYADGGNGKQPTITGYEVTESLTATLHDLKKAGDAITAAAQAGGDASRVTSVSLDLTDTGALITAARGKAFQQAKEKAEQYAKAAGVGLGGVVSISEQVATPSPMYDMAPSAMAAAGKSVPVAAGSQEVGVTVTVVFGLG